MIKVIIGKSEIIVLKVLLSKGRIGYKKAYNTKGN